MITLLDLTPPFVESHEGTRASLKMVSCVIRPEMVERVRDALLELNLVGGMTVADVRGFGRQKGSIEHYMGVRYEIRFINKVKLDMVISRDDLEAVLKVIGQHAHTGEVGDGKVFVVDVVTALRIRTGEKGVSAL